ncbi:RNA helicase required for poly(A+) mRNA export [Venturia inaequalis]|uniref:RNA helicase n=1 Tax=Venturia inaequalis TaxID=5025 RepID=A0A8H3YVG6_VENIN|nr:RNA helicase required for poly(A+) mRNA export [Venturia inaequalis]
MSDSSALVETAAPSLASRITRDEPAKAQEESTTPAETAAAPAETTETTKTEVAEGGTDGASTGFNGSELRDEPEFDVEVKLIDMQVDPNSPLFSIKRFEDLNLPEAALKGIFTMNFRKPSKIQERALPLLLHDPPQNLIGQSQSGTGKTAAFVLNMLSRVDLNLNKPQALVLAPSRELARQIEGVVRTMGQYMTGLNVAAAIPDPTRRGPVEAHIVVGTPGTVTDLIRRRTLDARAIKVLVLDEADNMLDQQGLGDQCKRVKTMLPKDVQTTLFSATFPEDVLHFAQIFAPNSNMITLKTDELTVEGIAQYFFDCDSEETKYETLVQFYSLLSINSSIIFVKRETAAEIERRMTADGHQVAHLSGALEGKERDNVIDKFRSGAAKVLITTNVLARGIDVQTVTAVVNYDIPEKRRGEADPETYLHRIGRTGRFGKVGVAISFVSDREGWQMLEVIKHALSCQISPLPTGNWDEVEATLKKTMKSSRAGKTTREMQGSEMALDGAAA